MCIIYEKCFRWWGLFLFTSAEQLFVYLFLFIPVWLPSTPHLLFFFNLKPVTLAILVNPKSPLSVNQIWIRRMLLAKTIKWSVL